MVYAIISIGILGFAVWSHHMYTVGLDVDKFVFTKKILLYAGNSYLSSPLVFFTLGTIYLYIILGQSAGNFSFSSISSDYIDNILYILNSKYTYIFIYYMYLLKRKFIPYRYLVLIKNLLWDLQVLYYMTRSYNTYTQLPLISNHVPKHNSNITDNDFGYYLAGLIEGDGWFGKNQLIIVFAENDTSLAYYIKKRIGFGNIYKIKNKKAVKYICKNFKGLSIILSLINGKLVSFYKYNQLIKHQYNIDYNYNILPPLNSLSLDNFWLAGFAQADGCFHISIVKSKTHKTGFSIRLEFSIKQKDPIPLNLLYNIIKKGNLSQYSSGIWCYKSTGYKTAAILINYFDKFNIFSGKYINYLKFRKVYIMITKGLHLEEKGVKKIISIRTKGSSETSTQEI